MITLKDILKLNFSITLLDLEGGKIQIADDVNELNFCCCCGSRNKMRRLKGADDE